MKFSHSQIELSDFLPGKKLDDKCNLCIPVLSLTQNEHP